jgi:VWFA-related protein
MRTALVILGGALLAATPLALGQQAAPGLFKIDMEDPIPKRDANGTMVTLKFTLRREGRQANDVGKDYKIIVYEERKEVARLDVPQAKVSENLSVVVAGDISGSMAEPDPDNPKLNRMDQMRAAANIFLQKLPAKAPAGLILFDHDPVKFMEPLTLDRQLLIDKIQRAQPSGGTAYIDATIAGVKMLAAVKFGGKAIVVMTDGVDLNSKNSLEQAITRAKKAKVKVYTVGIGKKGTQEKITSVLVLDRSGSMLLPADDQDKIPKIQALKGAAKLFMSFVREVQPPIARTTILTFSDVPSVPLPFTNDHVVLRRLIDDISAKGETALFDATYEAISALEAENPPGKRVVVALTDGVDNTSRRRVGEVIDLAKKANIKLYMLGFGRPGELDEKVMREMADKTQGKFYHAKNQKSLMDIFEKLSNQIHDDGIDEAALKQLADETGGRYFHAQDVGKMKFVLEQVAGNILEKKYEITFRSQFGQIGAGVNYYLKLVRLNGEEVGSTSGGGFEVIGDATVQDVRHGLVVPGLNQFVYLFFLLILGTLLALPAGFRRLRKSDS